MSYTTYDFSESLSKVNINPSDIKQVEAAWGHGEGQGIDSGCGWSTKGVSEWAGGFLFQLKTGEWKYVTGWCDYTGWGCQDGAEIVHLSAQPSFEEIQAIHEKSWTKLLRDYWDEQPADLNLWLERGAKDMDRW